MSLTWIENPESVGLRLVGLAHEVGKAGYSYRYDAVDHTGWFLNEFQDEKVCGVVYQLSGKNRRARYVVGYADPYNDGPACLDLTDILVGEITDCYSEHDPILRDAATRADGIAERMAEDERAYQEAWQAGVAAKEKAYEARESAKLYVKAVRLLRDFYAKRGNMQDKTLARRLGVELICDVRDACTAMTSARETFHSALESGHGWNCGNCDAWNEGYQGT